MSNGNIYIYGAPASGKSTLGKALAEKIGADFTDLDAVIVERAGMPIPEIFATKGEAAFRDIESDALRDLATRESKASVVSLGGGSLLRDESRALCESTGTVFCIDTPSDDELVRRIGAAAGSRPLGNKAKERAGHYASFPNRVAAFFDAQAAVLDGLAETPNTEKTVAFFYISSDGSVGVRGAGDYVAGMIELAGGRYIFNDTAALDSARAAVTISMEDFYAAAVDADFLIYNASIDAPLNSLDDLLGKSALFADFKAVKEGNVWSTDKYLYQATDIVGELINVMHRMLTGQTEGMTFIHRLQ